MTTTEKSLLPSGFYDLLPPDAAFEATLVYTAMQNFAAFGYDRVKPPLLEFEDSLLASASGTLERNTFRVMDPISQEMMGIRADMTMQIGRIALARMKKERPFPLRLCYSGTTLITKPNALFPARQHVQAGAELIGEDTSTADAEAIIVAVQGLKRMRVRDITVDLNLPSLVKTMLEDEKLDIAEKRNIMKALANKDISPLSELNPPLRTVLSHMCETVGHAETVLDEMRTLPLPEKGHGLCRRLGQIVTHIRAAFDDVTITIDPTENRGFDYHGGVSFALFAKGIEGEIGRGGRYRVAYDGETSAIGSTLYITRLLPILKRPEGKPCIYVPRGTDFATLQVLQQQGYRTVNGLEEEVKDSSAEELEAQAKHMQCSHWWDGTTICDVKKD